MTGCTDARMTRQRRVILEELSKVKTHPTAEELHGQVRRRMPRISLATVYRNLEWLAARGCVRRLDSGGGRRRFDACTVPHYHVRCIACGAVADLRVAPLTVPDASRVAPAGWQITGHEIDFVGYCGACMDSRRP